MGVSTDAILFYGFCYDDEGDDADWNPRNVDWFEASEQWEDEHCPQQPPRPPQGATIDAYNTPEWVEWRKRMEHWRKTGDGVRVGEHCSGDYPMLYVSLTAHTHKAHRGYPEEIKPGMLAVTAEQEAALKAFCERFGFKYKGPRWWLVSWWG
jgi:hypothetical protein